MLPGFLKHNRRLLKLFRFCVVGGSAFVLSIVMFNVLKNYIPFFGVHFVIASIIGDLSGLVYGFYINKHWTFTSQKKDEEKYFFKYLLLYTFTIVLNSLLLKAFIWVLTYYTILDESINQNIRENLAKISATVITTVLNFIGTNYVIFVHEEGEREEEEIEEGLNLK
jgi:putative flippase GtrA